MRSILVLGAGRSSSALIEYLLENAKSNEWTVVVGDLSQASVLERIKGSPHGQFVYFDINDDERSSQVIGASDIVISLLPAHFHPRVARHCLQASKHLLTASYVSDEMRLLHADALSRNLLFLNECGLDPGIDHMSAMQIIERVRKAGGQITSFESFTGGLIAPDTDPDNPWRYKFTWNPRNVVLAGQGTARFLQDNDLKYVPYQQLFRRTTRIEVPGYGLYDGYVNRDSLKYIETYGLSDISTMLRGTLRHVGFCDAWDILVQMGCCDDTYMIENARALTHAGFMNCFLDGRNGLDIVRKVCSTFQLDPAGEEIARLRWSGFFSDEIIGLDNGTPAQITEHILNKKWQLREGDRDMIVMWHRFHFELEGRHKQIQASLVAIGQDSTYTAMAKTVGLPLAIAAKLLMNGKVTSRGVVIPMTSEWYNPILSELSTFGIELQENER